MVLGGSQQANRRGIHCGSLCRAPLGCFPEEEQEEREKHEDDGSKQTETGMKGSLLLLHGIHSS